MTRTALRCDGLRNHQSGFGWANARSSSSVWDRFNSPRSSPAKRHLRIFTDTLASIVPELLLGGLARPLLTLASRLSLPVRSSPVLPSACTLTGGKYASQQGCSLRSLSRI